jgi:hypothetical protein
MRKQEKAMNSMGDNAMPPPVLSSLGRNLACLSVLLLLAMVGTGAPRADALGTAPETENFIQRFSEFGSGAAQSKGSVGLATSPITGDVYISDYGNSRIDVFSPWGQFISAFGWGVADGTTAKLQSCTVACFSGLEGAGAGEFAASWGIAVDSSGAIYVRDERENRVQKFNPSGQFLLMFGGEVNKTQVHKREAQEAKSEVVTVTTAEENLCTAVSGEECGAGTTGSGPGQMSGNGLAITSSGTIAVGDRGRIEEFNPDGTFASEVPLPGEAVREIAVDPSSNDFYITIDASEAEVAPNVQRLSATGVLLGTLEVARPEALATDAAGNVYVSGIKRCDGQLAVCYNTNDQHVFEFDKGGSQIAEFDEAPRQSNGQPPFFLNGLGTNTVGDLYVSSTLAPPTSFFSAYGPPPVNFEPPPKIPPTVNSEYAASVEQDHAIVRSQINPHFWSDTTFYVQYGLDDCESSECASQPTAPGSRLTSTVVDQPVTSSGVLLSGLQSDTTYHYRFVSEGGGGGPVFGPDRTFTTPSAQVADTNCPNQVFRTAASASLPDCRAYEMVSPIEKDGGNILTRLDITDNPTGIDQSAAQGEKLIYSSYRAFGEPKGAPFTSDYLAARNPTTGWSTETLNPVEHPGQDLDPRTFQSPYRAFSADLSVGWLALLPGSMVANGVPEGSGDLDKRSAGSAGLEPLILADPAGFSADLQGFTANGAETVFDANGGLTSVTPVAQVYETDGSGTPQLISVLPSGLASTQSATTGGLANNAENPPRRNEGIVSGGVDEFQRNADVKHAVSDDGSRIYWSEIKGETGPARIYVRENPAQEQSPLGGAGECLEPADACTLTVSSKGAQFWAASADGSSAIYTVEEGAHKGELDEFNIEEGTSTPLAEKVVGVVGASDDLSHVYFVSTEVLAHGAIAGEPNLYLRDDETTDFIGTLSSTDTAHENKLVSDTEALPLNHVARVTPDGRHVVFISTAALTGYDNQDIVSGKSDSEVYIYDADSHTLDCASCDASGARPEGREVELIEAGGHLPTAASLPPPQSELYSSRVLSDDGSRLFFDSYAGLVPGDTNGKEDVYEWEIPGSGDCTELSSSFSVRNGGCVGLISSGVSPSDSAFVDASASGSDAFFTTGASLVSQDPGSVDIYDARIDGGFPVAPAPPGSCEGEACQGASAPPIDPTPASASFSGPGNLVSALTTGGALHEPTVVTKEAAVRARAAKLASALSKCRKRARGKARKSCEATARKRYGTSSKHKTVKSTKGGQ